MTTTIDEARLEGALSQQKGKKLHECPYHLHAGISARCAREKKDLRHAWLNGWFDAVAGMVKKDDNKQDG